MLLPRKWALSLGLLATVPGVTVAGPLDFLKGPEKQEAAASSPTQSNQEVAENIAKALSKVPLVHKDVDIQFQGGVAIIRGQIKDASQRALVTKVTEQVPGVQTVQNEMQLMETVAAKPGPVQTAGGAAPAPSEKPVQQVNFEASPAFSNQQVAQSIAEALTGVGLSGYDIEIRYKNGVASLIGSVEDPIQAQQAERVTAQVPGVKQVLNRLSVTGTAHNIQQTGGFSPYGPSPGPFGAPHPQYGPPGQPHPPVMPMGAQGGPGMAPPPGMPAPQFGHVQPAGHHIYNQPNVPEYAWPSYAPYDNSAAVTYPSMYDASAWPYIGPYYPYPQVPLGWRQSTLEWDDGYWSLKFDSKTDKWWWFLNPHNWH